MIDLNIGQLYFTARGIAEIQSFYQESELDKVRFWLHTVDKNDGVTATGDAVLMSTTPEILQDWIATFPQDLGERRRAIVSKNLHEILNKIDQAMAEGPKVLAKRGS